MGSFLTSHTRLIQTGIKGIWCTEANQLFKDDDGRIFLAPICTLTDGYSIPKPFHFIAGGMFEHDTRPAVQHDWECYYHKALVVNMTEVQLRKAQLLRYENGLWICDDIPFSQISVVETTFDETNSRFRRMLKSIKTIPDWQKKMIGDAVNLNIGWLKKPIAFEEDRLYRVDYRQVRR